MGNRPDSEEAVPLDTLIPWYLPMETPLGREGQPCKCVKLGITGPSPFLSKAQFQSGVAAAQVFREKVHKFECA